MLSKLRVGLSWPITSFGLDADRRQLAGQQLGRAGAELADSSWTITAVLATPPAALLSSPSAAMPWSTQAPKPGLRRNTFLRPRLTIRSEAPTSIRNGVLYLAAAWLAAMPTRALVAADVGRDARLVHLLDLGHADLDLGLAVAPQRLELGAAHRLDAARLVEVVDRHGGAEPALAAGEGHEAGHGMDDADLHGGRLRAADQGEAQRSGRQDARSGDEPATRNRHFVAFSP